MVDRKPPLELADTEPPPALGHACSFCGRHQGEVRRIIVSAKNPSLTICCDCAELGAELVKKPGAVGVLLPTWIKVR